jgi:hypothetical protein
MNSAIQLTERHEKTLMKNMKILWVMLGTSDLALPLMVLICLET